MTAVCVISQNWRRSGAEQVREKEGEGKEEE